jgi:ATP-dependent DNA ligase
MRFAIEPPIKPMLAKVAEEIPETGEYLFEPKWDGFRAIAFRGGTDVYIQSRWLRCLETASSTAKS